jgi:hypothetical protein
LCSSKALIVAALGSQISLVCEDQRYAGLQNQRFISALKPHPQINRWSSMPVVRRFSLIKSIQSEELNNYPICRSAA